MHSIKYANRVKNRYLVLDDPELEKATDAWVTLTEKLGDDEADRWFDENITDTDAWPEITQKIGTKLDELAKQAAFSRIDRSEQMHPGAM